MRTIKMKIARTQARLVALCVVLLVSFLLTSTFVNAQSSGALIEKAIELIDSRDYRTAESLLRRVISQDPNDALGNYYLAEALAYQGNKKEALKYYKAAAELSPNSRQGIDALAKAERIEDEPERNYSTCLKRGGDADEACVNRATNIQGNDAYKRAMARCNDESRRQQIACVRSLKRDLERLGLPQLSPEQEKLLTPQ